jgi:hypothetical protein
MRVVNLRETGTNGTSTLYWDCAFFTTVYIGRGSDFGNPFSHIPINRTQALVQTTTAEQSVDWYHQWAMGATRWDDVIPKVRRKRLLAAIATLKEDDVLGCFCGSDKPCHGHVIMALWQEMQRAPKKVKRKRRSNV